MSNAIQFITAIPRNIESYLYYINDDMTSSHSLKQDAMYLFICSLIRAPTTATVLEFIEKHYAFIVNIRRNSVDRFIFDSSDELKEMRQKLLNPGAKGVEKILKGNKDTMDQIRDRWSENTTKKYANQLDNFNKQKYTNDKGSRFLRFI